MVRKKAFLPFAVFFFLSQFDLLASSWDPVRGPQGAWVYVVIQGVDKIQSRLLKAAEKVGPEAAQEVKKLPQSLPKDIARQVGVSPDSIDMSKPFAVVIGNPLMQAGATVGIFPVKQGAQVKGQLVNGYAVTGENEMFVQQISQSFSSAGTEALKPPKGVAHIYLDLQTVVGAFGPLVQMQLSSMALSQAQQPAAMQSALAAMNLILSLLGQLEGLSVDLDVSESEVIADNELKVKPGTDLAGLFSNQGQEGTSLGNLFDPAAFNLSLKLKGLTGFAYKLSDQFLSKTITDPKEAEETKKAMQKFFSKAGDELALALDFQGKAMLYSIALRFEGSLEDLREYWEFFVEKQTSPSFLSLTAGGLPGLKMKYQLKKEAYTCEGVPVDSFLIKLEQPEGQEKTPMLEEQLKAVKAVWGGDAFRMDCALVNNTAVFVTAPKGNQEKLSQLISKVKSGDLGSPPQTPGAFRVDPIPFIKWIAEFRGITAPPLEGEAQPIAGNFRFEDRSLKSKVTLPLSLISKLMSAAESKETTPAPLSPKKKAQF